MEKIKTASKKYMGQITFVRKIDKSEAIRNIRGVRFNIVLIVSANSEYLNSFSGLLEYIVFWVFNDWLTIYLSFDD